MTRGGSESRRHRLGITEESAWIDQEAPCSFLYVRPDFIPSIEEWIAAVDITVEPWQRPRPYLNPIFRDWPPRLLTRMLSMGDEACTILSSQQGRAHYRLSKSRAPLGPIARTKIARFLRQMLGRHITFDGHDRFELDQIAIQVLMHTRSWV